MSTVVRKPDPLRRQATACGCLIAMVILFAAFGPKAELPLPTDRADVVDRRELSFADVPDGTVIVIDKGTDREITRLGVGEGGFVRSTMRSLARERAERRISRDPPFILERLSDGTVVLSDPETKAMVRLTAFGRTNAASFAAFLDEGRNS